MSMMLLMVRQSVLLVLLVLVFGLAGFLLLLLRVRRVVIAGTPSGMYLHVEFLLLASHFVVLGLFCSAEGVPLETKT